MNYRSCQTRIIRLFLLARRLRPTCCFLNQKPAVISIKAFLCTRQLREAINQHPGFALSREALPARSLAGAKL